MPVKFEAPRVPRPGRLRVKAVAPNEQLLEIMTSPVLHSGFDGRELVQVELPVEACSVFRNLDPFLVSQNTNLGQDGLSWAELEYKFSNKIRSATLKIEIRMIY
jgi:hypothetical protein